MSDPLTRRAALQLGLTGLVAGTVRAADPPSSPTAPARPFLTPARDFRDVSRGKPIPHTLTGEALVQARLTPETWRLEIITADKADAASPAKVARPLTLAAGTALDLPALLKLGEEHSVRFLKAMQCANIPRPLGQGLWEGVPLRDVLGLAGKRENVRRVYFWGYHNDKPEQKFQSSLAFSQVFDTPPGEMPPFLAYKLNGEPIPLTRGGPVRMIVPWAHGFKSIKWLHTIVLTNGPTANDTYADAGNDPESFLKTAAYLDDTKPQEFAAGKPVVLRGTCMVGWPGLERVEYWLRPDAGADGKLSADDPAWAKAEWRPGGIDPPSADWSAWLPAGVPPKTVWGFGPDGKPTEWPLRYSIAHWTVTLADLKPGKYELRVRTVDRNSYAQPEPRPGPPSGMNAVACKLFEVK
jgi:DMSO/TMAO reductase YedYZ molybdopterin-dependent catalytic subunit